MNFTERLAQGGVRQMKLTKQEQAVVIGKLINNVIGVELVQQRIDAQKLERAISLHNEMNDDMTPKQTREALISVLDKTIDEFIKE
ncbi:phage protein (plasmid) [Bacillus mycoides KBAB4]|uniref:Phage protein n=2 Tax=Bacillus mycoides TaxID=1405 RepID=A9VVR9_BACMK|nr:phage protein [Bacillus mycoides KBAB4]